MRGVSQAWAGLGGRGPCTYPLYSRPSPPARCTASAIGQSSKEHLCSLAGNCNPLTVWRERNIPNWQCTSGEHLLVCESVERIHAYGTILGSGKEEVILLWHKLPMHACHTLRWRLTVAAIAVLFSWQSSKFVGSPSEPVS